MQDELDDREQGGVRKVVNEKMLCFFINDPPSFEKNDGSGMPLWLGRIEKLNEVSARAQTDHALTLNPPARASFARRITPTRCGMLASRTVAQPTTQAVVGRRCARGRT